MFRQALLLRKSQETLLLRSYNNHINSYKISINYCSIKKQIVIILSKILQFSEHFQLIFDNSNVNNDKQIKHKIANFFSANFSKLSNFSLSSFWEKPFWYQKLLLLTATVWRYCYTLIRPFPTLSCLPFFGTNFRHQNKNNFIEATSYFVYQLSKKYCIYYVSEHLKYCRQINEYWLNKNACLNIVFV